MAKRVPEFTARSNKKPWTWWDAIYHIDYLLFVCPPATMVEWCSRVLKTDLTVPESGASGQTIWLPDENRVLLWFSPTQAGTAAAWASIVAHESMHAALDVLQGVGMPLNDGSDEAWAYYLGWIVEETTTRLRLKLAG